MKQFSIKQVAEMTGFTPSALRIWEARYNWPRSHRADNGYRVYTDIDIDEIKKVRLAMEQTGKPISSFIVDGFVEYHDKTVVIEPIPKVDYSSLPRPTSNTALALFNTLVKALEANKIPEIVFAVQSACTIRPSDRPTAIIEPVKKWISAVEKVKRMSNDVEDLKKLIASVKV